MKRYQYRSDARWAAAIAVRVLTAMAILVVVALVIRAASQPDDLSTESVVRANTPAATTRTSTPGSTSTSASAPASTTMAQEGPVASTTEGASNSAAVPTSTGAATTTTDDTATIPETTTPAATGTTEPTPTSTQSTPQPPSPGVGPTLPDGTPVPVLALFDAEVIRLTGSVPNQAAKDRLGALALANSKTSAALDNQLVIDPAVPAGVGVRIIELNSVRFPPGSAEILPEHAREFDRISSFMKALPNVTALVVGHADQVGGFDANFSLSEARARNAVTYLVSTGIAASRLSSRAVGEADLLSLGSDETSLALNRRTELILYGLLIT